MFGVDYAKSFPTRDANDSLKARLVLLACGTEHISIEPDRKFDGWAEPKGGLRYGRNSHDPHLDGLTSPPDR
ncbi:hypothetical protein P12x_001666 [Tundrisphaera lichenicola]|uniref:hypothetical protein n=1 Tax=Tundrisphaera lichenicola TaxID=2029860 RepID=UPI003EBA2419